MDNLYKFNSSNPFHISVGAVLFNKQNKVCVHKYCSEKTPNQVKHLMGGLDVVHILMRETLQDDESLEKAVHRGLREEFGAEGETEKYLGSIVCPVEDGKGRIFEKTTLYHSVRLKTLGERDPDDDENFSEILWLAPNVLLQIMQKQEHDTKRQELHESIIMGRFKEVYGT